MLKTTRIQTHLNEDAPFSCVIPTRNADVDRLGHINNVATLQIIEDACSRFTYWMGVPALIPEGVRMLFASIQVDYVGEAYYPEPYVVHVAVAHVGRSSWTYLLTARQASGIVAAAINTLALRSNPGASILSDPVRNRLAQHMPSSR